jgi:DNA-binding CsgD family transcriptional regulator
MADATRVSSFRRIAPVSELSPAQRLQLEGLTAREAEVVLLVGRGLLQREIAARLMVARGTVKTLIDRARLKLGCDDSRQLMRLLLLSSLIDLADLSDGGGRMRPINPRVTNNLPAGDRPVHRALLG